MPVNPWLLERLACPVDGSPLRETDSGLVSEAGREYAVVEGIPILIDESVSQIAHSRTAGERHQELTERARAERDAGETVVDRYVQEDIVGTNGRLYRKLKGRLTRYPIPDFPGPPAPPGEGRALLDIGCNWGRWLVSSARAGYRPVGIDPGLDALLAAKRVGHDCGVEIHVVNAGGQALPFRDRSFGYAYSFSVLQHLPKADATQALTQVGRVLEPGGECLVQLPAKWGALSLYNCTKRGWREPTGNMVRYWSIPELRRTFEKAIGPSKITAHAFFSLNPVQNDLELLPLFSRSLVHASNVLCAACRALPPLCHLADSLWIRSTRPADSGAGVAASAPVASEAAV